MLKREKVKLQIKPSPGQSGVQSVSVTPVVIVIVELLQLLHYLIQLLPASGKHSRHPLSW